jgi:uncharacterized protein
MDETSEVVELPLFPLHTVLFPGQMLPLHIFEPRYQQMIRHCLAEELPFGVVLIRKGHEVADENTEPHMVGTIARIVESTHLADGTMNIVAIGLERFRILRLIHDQPYLRGEVANFPLLDVEAASVVESLATTVRGQVTRYIRLIADAAGLEIQLDEMPETPRQVGYLAAVAMQIDNVEKQKLLDITSLQGVLLAEKDLLSRENALLNWMISTKEWSERVQFGASGTLLPN